MMDIERDVGQMFMIGFDGEGLTPDIKTLIKEFKIGGVILFRRNLKDRDQVRRLCQELQDFSLSVNHTPLFIAIDQEGGVVSRLDRGVSVFPGNMALGATRSEHLSYTTGKIMALELRALGINLNLAPVLDVNTNPANPGIGVRSYGDDPQLVSRMGLQMIKGMKDGGLFCCAKHFPGKGDAELDAHIALPRVSKGRRGLHDVELVPFKSAIKEGVDFCMVSHVLYPSVDPTWPASLSDTIISGLLKVELGFPGVVITDDLEMGAIKESLSIPEASKRSIMAGADVILICHRRDLQVESIKALIYAVRRGEVPRRRIDDAMDRILALKTREDMFQVRGDIASLVKGHGDITIEIADRSITKVRDKKGLLPISIRDEERLLVVVPTLGALTQVEEESEENPSRVLINEFTKRHKQSDCRIVKLDPEPEEIKRCSEESIACPIVVVITCNAQFFKGQVELVKKIYRKNKNLIVISLRNPYDLSYFPEVETFVAAYSFRRPSIQAASRVLFGEVSPTGRLPVNVKV
jgi:beta-N-acetylhexosaminidase